MLLSWAGSGGTRNALTKGMIESLNVYAPADVDEQRAIAHVLGTLDDKIELNRRMNKTLEGMARALFQSWFVDFDPVRAKAALRASRRRPNHSPLEGESGRQGRQPAGEPMGGNRRHATPTPLARHQTPIRRQHPAPRPGPAPKPDQRRGPAVVLPARQTGWAATNFAASSPSAHTSPTSPACRKSCSSNSTAASTPTRPAPDAQHGPVPAATGLPRATLLEPRSLCRLLRRAGEHLCRPNSSPSP